MSSSQPLLSYIVLSYNYQDYIGQTIESIQAQGVSDFEIVVVDDCSSDGSRDVVRAIDDSRIRLMVNERNLGGAGAYNRAVDAARGTWLVNLDADDWINPGKAEAQLELAAANPSLDVIGTFVAFVDPKGEPHRESAALESVVNRQRDLNLVDAWIGCNPLCRSSTMVRRSAHLRVGLDDPDMVRAPDYELWTRFLRHSCRFAVIPEKLTCYRLQPRGVTHGDPVESLIEMAWATLRNLVPVIEQKALWPSFSAALYWISRHAEFSALSVRERQNMLTLLLTGDACPNYATFRTRLAAPLPGLEVAGPRVLAALGGLADLGQWPQRLTSENAKLMRDVEAYLEARDFWHRQVEPLRQEGFAYLGARDYWHDQSQCWQDEAERLGTSVRELEQRLAARETAATTAGPRGDGQLEETRWTSLPKARMRAAAQRFWRSFPFS